jgi:formamidopyrimidine-DNA glycosylase
MPELPEVEAVCRRLREQVLGAGIRRVELFRPAITKPQPPDSLDSVARGARIGAVERRGKHILLHLSNAHTLHLHLRMTGNLFAIPDARLPLSRYRALIHLKDGRGIAFEDPRALGRMHIHPTSELGALLDQAAGLEPLSPQFTPEALVALARASRLPAKLFLMDQRRVAGLGNIYAAEVLFRARIHPSRRMRSVASHRLATLHTSIVRVLSDAVNSVYLTYSAPGHMLASEAETLMVYGREGEPCKVCGRAIRRIPQGGRSTYYCPRCQT